MILGLDLCESVLPDWDPESGATDLYYWYFATLVFGQQSGGASKAWRTRIENALLTSQHSGDTEAYEGSWDPAGPWGPDGGRIYSTSIALLSLATPARFDRGFWNEPKPDRPFADAVKALKAAAKNKQVPDELRDAAKRWLDRS